MVPPRRRAGACSSQNQPEEVGRLMRARRDVHFTPRGSQSRAFARAFALHFVCSGNKIVAAALLRHAQRSARLPCSTPTAVEGGVALKPHACRRISRQSAASRALAAVTRSHRSWSGEGTAKGGEGVQCAADFAKRGRGADVVERREEDGDQNMEEGELSCLARAVLKPLLRPGGRHTHEVLAWVHKSENDTVAAAVCISKYKPQAV